MMKLSLALAVAVLPILLTGCATPPAPQAYHNTEAPAIVIESLDGHTSQMIQPVKTGPEPNSQLLAEMKKMPQNQTVIIILENYAEPQIGPQFRDRSMPWFLSLRGIRCEHIFFLQGKGVPDAEGLLTLAEYN